MIVGQAVVVRTTTIRYLREIFRMTFGATKIETISRREVENVCTRPKYVLSYFTTSKIPDTFDVPTYDRPASLQTHFLVASKNLLPLQRPR
jgi:hypothetical protein